MQRRQFIQRALTGLTGLGVLSGLYAWQIEPFRLEFVELPMPIKHLPDALVGKKLMQISDLHVGNRFNHQYIIDAFTKAKAYQPDFVVYTGDYISLHKDAVQWDKLSAVLKHSVTGTIATIGILGNHDYGKNWAQPEVADRIANTLAEQNILVLRNESITIAGLHVIGFDDYWGLNFQPEKAMHSFDPSKASIALCHNPDVCDLPVWGEYNSWILAGHTHGGQVKPPFLPPLILPVKNKQYAAGKYALSNERTLYINRALGHLWQVRFNVRPEITIFTLQQA
jgi:predicted MPP superfamily phosphohydrolase